MKKFLAVLLSVIFILSCFALTASAVNASNDDFAAISSTDDAEEAETESPNIIKSVFSFFWDIIVKIREVFVQYLVYPLFNAVIAVISL